MLHTELDGIIFDLDGVIKIDGFISTEAVQLIDRLNRIGLPFCILTNDCTRSVQFHVQELAKAGAHIGPNQLITPLVIFREWMSRRGGRLVYYLGSSDALQDLHGLTLSRDGVPDFVVVGDLFSCYSRESLQRAVDAVSSGAELVALQTKRTWLEGTSRRIDNGFWVAGLEFVTNTRAVNMGKPSAIAYEYAMRILGIESGKLKNIAMVSDEIFPDLEGATSLGIRTIHVGSRVENAPNWLTTSVTDLKELDLIPKEGRSGLS